MAKANSRKKKGSFRWRPQRRSQIITTFGVGAILDFPGESLMTAGLDKWPWSLKYKHLRITDDQRLARRLGVGFFISPPQPPEEGLVGAMVKAVRFPLWHYCRRCGAMKFFDYNTERKPKDKASKKQFQCRSDIKLRKDFTPCSELPRKLTLTPVRFIIACPDGHIDDFPWHRWVHRKDGQDLDDVKTGLDHQLRFSSSGAGLGGVWVECITCGKKKSLSLAGAVNGLKSLSCSGARPWLGPDGVERGCQQTPRLCQRGASNLYMSTVIDSILIPSEKIEEVDENILRLLSNDDSVRALTESGEPDEDKIRLAAEMYRVPFDRLLREVRIILELEEREQETPQEENAYRSREYEEITQAGDNYREDQLVITPQSIKEYDEPVREYFKRVTLIEKLALTRAFVGFSRLNGRMVNQNGLALRRQHWLPGIRIFGEGVFLVLKKDVIDKWQQNEEVKKRTEKLRKKENEMAEGWGGGQGRSLPPKFFLLHALAHLLISRLSFECGYGSSSLNERIYCDYENNGSMQGILIYTAAGDTEGTMGGLVQQGRAERFSRLFRDAVLSSAWCSSDPVCIESSGQGSDSSNLAACHGCLLLPETSCEERNRLLDRGCLVGTPDHPEIGFFRKLIDDHLGIVPADK